ncbi:MAG TPA: hypothetical protein VEB43_20325 [Anaeromyxobacter sp.]|nr:hypothetical protein [Anaeromyxobacter sp.]
MRGGMVASSFAIPLCLAILALAARAAASEHERRFLFFTGSLAAVDPDAPAAPPRLVIQGATSHRAGIRHGTLDPTTGMLSDVHLRTVVLQAGGRLHAVRAIPEDGAPVAVQLSSEDLEPPAVICESPAVQVVADYADPDDSWYLYTVSAPDGSCGADVVRKAVRVGMSADDAPVVVEGLGLARVLRDPATGAISGWLARSGAEVVALDPDFGSPATIAALPSAESRFEVIHHVSGDRMLARVDGALHLLDLERGLAPEVLHTYAEPTAPSERSRADAAHLFFLDGPTIYRIPLDGSAPAAPLVSVTRPEDSFSDFALTDEALVYVLRAEQDGDPSLLFSLGALPKGGAPAVTQLTGGKPDVPLLEATAGSRVFFNWLGSEVSAAAVDDDGTGLVERAGTLWVGVAYSPDHPLGSRPAPPHRLVLAEKPAAGASGFGGGRLIAYAPTGAPVAVLGAVPSDIDALAFSGYGTRFLGSGFDHDDLSSGTSRADVFFVDTEREGSLVRVTDGPGQKLPVHPE